jgi:hypothetical protein
VKFQRFVPPALVSTLPLASVLLTAQPSQAAIACATEGTSFSSAQVFDPSFECFIEDKTFKNFTLDPVNPGSVAGISWNWGVVPGDINNQYTLQGIRSSGLSDFKFTYQVDITAPGYFFDRFRTSATTSIIDSPQFIKSLNPIGGGAEVATAAGGGFSPVGTFVPDTLTSIVFETELKNTGTGAAAQNFTDTIIQRNPPPPMDAVPGPLPIVGAGMAFAYSRKLRGRIAKAV